MRSQIGMGEKNEDGRKKMGRGRARWGWEDEDEGGGRRIGTIGK